MTAVVSDNLSSPQLAVTLQAYGLDLSSWLDQWRVVSTTSGVSADFSVAANSQLLPLFGGIGV